MNTSEKLSLKWNDFQENSYTAFGLLRKDKHFNDVTLVCEDGNQMEAHKIILAASSPFFQNLFINNKHAHPLIYMRGMKSEDLVAVVDFLYNGEASIYQESIDNFLTIAKELQLKGLQGKEINDEENFPKHPKSAEQKHQSDNSIYPPILTDSVHDGPEPLHNSLLVEKTEPARAVAMVNAIFNGDIQKLDEKIKSMMTKGKTMRKDGKQRNTACSVCGKEGQSIPIREHIEKYHIGGLEVPCSLCGKIFKARESLRKHKSFVHSQETN